MRIHQVDTVELSNKFCDTLAAEEEKEEEVEVDLFSANNT